MSEFPPTREELLETFEDLGEWEDRYDFIIDLGRELPELPEAYRDQVNLVEGCMSTVWLHTEITSGDEPVEISADSDSLIVKGLIVVMLAYYSRLTATEIVQADVSKFLGELGLNQHLSPQRRNGLFAMIKRLRQNVTEALASVN